jgi:MFS family permease
MITELGSYHCDKEGNLAIYRMLLFGGIFLGYLVFMHYSDNIGRRFGMILTSLTTTLGFLLISLSGDIWQACLGLLLAGAGCESNMRINLSILNEIVDYQLRQTYSLVLQCSFGVGGIFVALGYWYFRDWRMVTHVFCTVPSLLFLAIILVYLEETPNHLLKKGSKAVLASLRRIARINGLQCTITEQDILKVIELKAEHMQQQSHSVITFALTDLWKYKSLRSSTNNLAAIFLLISALYIGPSSAIDRFDLNIFILQTILSLSECIAYPIAVFFIAKTKRQAIGIKCFMLCGLFNIIAFAIPSSGCDYCLPNLVKIGLMFCSRFCVAYYYGILFIYVVEIYP